MNQVVYSSFTSYVL